MGSFTRRAALGLLAGAAVPLTNTPSARAASSTMRIGLSSSLVHLDPLLMTFGDEYVYANLVFNGLTRIAADLTLQPDLAERWTPSPDLKTWTFSLRKSVRFHDGTPMVAADVVAVFRRLLDPATAAPSASDFGMVASVDAKDDTTVAFHLSFPYGGFPELLSEQQVKIVPRGKVAQLTSQPVGTGPFRFVSYTPGDRMVLTKNPDYFEIGLPKLDGVELLIIPEMSAKIASLDAGNLDIVWDLPLDQVKSTAERTSVRVGTVPSGAWDAAIMNNLVRPFNDPRVRGAFQTALSKKQIVDLVLFGQGAPTISPIPPSSPYYAHDISFPPADPAAARRMLADAGYPQGIKLPIIVPVERPSRVSLGVVLQQLLQPAGFDLQVQRVPYSSYHANVSGKAPLYVDGFFGRPTVDASTYPFLSSQGAWNNRLWHYSNPAVDAALEAARRTGDAGEQRRQYVTMQHALYKDPACFFAYSLNFACAYRANVVGVRTNPMRWIDLRHASFA